MLQQGLQQQESIPSFTGLPEWSGRRTFLRATWLGLSWFPLIILAFLVGNTVAGTFVLHTSHPTPAQFQVFTFFTDLAMLIFSSVFCFLIVPTTFKRGKGGYRHYLEDIGILGGTWRTVVACGGLLAFLAVFIPLLVPSASWHVDVLSWLTLAQPPLVEETLFRGLVLALLLKRFPAWFAILWAAVLFMPPHLFEGIMLMLGNGLVFGVTQGILRLRTRSIWPGVIAHYAFVSGIDSPIFFAYVIVLGGLLLEWGLRRMLRKA